MGEELDINEVVAGFLNHKLDSLVETGKGTLKSAADKVRLHLDSTYREYLNCVLRKYSRAKSFFIRNEPVPLYSFYVPIGLSYSKNKTIDHAGIQHVGKVSQFSIITGLGGSGKSMFMRHLFLNSILTKFKVPVFVELRQLNQKEISLRQLIDDTLAINKLRPDTGYIDRALEAGHFLFLLDGFDEIALAKRAFVTSEIQTFTKRYDKTSIVVSSRPDTELEGWNDYTMFEITPLSLELAHELIDKVPYDDSLKAKFLKDLAAGLYEKHKSFLSNPLLLSIMLLTYSETAEIPSKLNVFYNQAYEALFQRHDALKSGFLRERRCRLDIQDFAKVFSAFSIQTYDKNEYQFTSLEALGYLEKAKGLAQIAFDSRDFLSDALQAVCLLVEEGLKIGFAHRSFQEYFTARFISEAKPHVQEKLLRRYAAERLRDSVVGLLYEMRPELVVHYYILPEFAALMKAIGATDEIGIEQYVAYLKLTYSRFSVSPSDVSGYPRQDQKHNFSDLVGFIMSRAGHMIGWSGYHVDGQLETKWMEKLGGQKGFRTKEFSTNDEFVKDLASEGGFFSLDTLQAAAKIVRVLEEQSKNVETALEDLLK